MSCYCDYDPPSFVRTAYRVARVQHRCIECGHIIAPGERYEYVTSKWDGEIGQFVTCEACADLRDSLAGANGGCLQYGGLADEYHQHLSNVLMGSDIDASEVFARIMAKHRAGAS